MGLVQGLNLTALAFILTAQMFRAMNPSLEEAAKIHGMSFAGTVRRITLPLAFPAILAAFIYMLTIGIATFDVPAIIGLGNRIYMLSTYVYLKANPPDSGLPQHGVTAALGTVMILLALLLTWWYSQVLRQGHRYEVITGKGYRPTLIHIGRWSVLAWGLIALYFLATKLIPLLLIAYAAFTPYLAPPSWEMLGKLSLAGFHNLNWDLFWRGLYNTVLLVVTVPLITLVLAFCISWLIVRSHSRMRYVLEFGAFLPHALPEVIMAIGALLLALFVLPKFIPLYGSVWLIAIVYVISRLAFATRALNSSLSADPQGARRSRLYRRLVADPNVMAHSRAAPSSDAYVGMDLVSDPGLPRAYRGGLFDQPGKHYLAGGDLELLVLRSDQPGGGGDFADDSRAHAADFDLLVVRPAPAHAGILTFAEITQLARLSFDGRN